ncbi:MAG: helix-turn-helix domain-containing protein [Gemmatimonadetes bacterium]|nr:helix-turn-helix domain-containing protein [Gemmatimonadota bacterium]
MSDLDDFLALSRVLRPTEQVTLSGERIAAVAACVNALLGKADAPEVDTGSDLTTAGVMKALGRSRTQVCHYATEGKFPGAYQMPDGSWRFPVSSLEAFKEAQRTPTRQQRHLSAVPKSGGGLLAMLDRKAS